jgi:hypothetical protein
MTDKYILENLAYQQKVLHIQYRHFCLMSIDQTLIFSLSLQKPIQTESQA